MPTKPAPIIPFQNIRRRVAIPMACLDCMKKHHLALNPNPNGCDDYLWVTFIPLGGNMAGKVAAYKHNRLGSIIETAAEDILSLDEARALWTVLIDSGWDTMDKVNY